MKITDYPRIPEADPSYVMLVDGLDGTKGITVDNLANSMKIGQGNVPAGVTFDNVYSLGWHVQNGSKMEEQIISDVEIPRLQATIDTLPKYLDRDVTIEVLAGTAPAGDLTISGFSGPGRLMINATGGVQNSHNVERIVLEHNTNLFILLSGFTATSSETFSFQVSYTTIAQLLNVWAINGLPERTNNGVVADSSYVILQSATISNKYLALHALNNATIGIRESLKGENNNNVFRGTHGGRIITSIDLSAIEITGTTKISCTQASTFIDATYGSGWHVQNGLFSGGIAYNDVPLSEFQSVIDSLPKYLNRNVVINLLPGTTTDTISIARMAGTGSLNINGGANSTEAINYKINALTTSVMNTGPITITGFTCTNTTGYSFRNEYTQSLLHINSCVSTGGIATDGANIGILGHYCVDVFVNNCVISNKYIAVNAANLSNVQVTTLSGAANRTGYNVSSGSRIHRRDAGTLAATTMYSASQGGIIVNPSGGIIGT